MTELEYWLWFASDPSIRPGAKKALLDQYGDPETIYALPKERLQIRGVSPAEAEKLLRRDPAQLKELQGQLEKQQLDFIPLCSSRYPEPLRNIFDPPVGLFVKGSLPDLQQRAAVAVIGTRHASPYGMKMGRSTAYQIASCGAVVISGLTAGIDARAAEGALEAGGTCIGVLGTAHERETGDLAARVERNGAVISEIPPGAANNRNYFRARNRIAAGLSVGVLVVEAPEKSGTRLFVAEALDQGKDIFVIPGNADSPNSAGIFAMMRDGAQPVPDGLSVVREYAMLYPETLCIPKTCEVPPEKKTPEPQRKKRQEEPAQIDRSSKTEYNSGPKTIPTGVTAEQRQILQAILAGAAYVDEITEAAGLPVAKVLAQLTILEIRGFVSRDPGKRYTVS
ncbi:MAG: DNA-protecting protein DprA [Oscillospiraceae bacterium]|nr:DNA-protecting protein DprA [Oscillospiraceae bacterium]